MNTFNSYGGMGNIQFPRQFDDSRFDKLDFGITPIQYFDYNNAIIEHQHATGFIYRSGEAQYLVTARHCLTGRDAFDDKLISKSGYIPSKIRIFPAVEFDKKGFTRITLDVDLTDESALLLDPEVSALNTDIAAVKLDNSNIYLDATLVQADGTMFATSGATCFVCGYPTSNFMMPYLPIWRRGSFATHPNIPINDKPLFLVDANTSRGMSGSPIFQRWFGPTPYVKDGQIDMKTKRVVSTRLVGIYGGRFSSSDDIGPIGYGWYQNRLDEILKSN